MSKNPNDLFINDTWFTGEGKPFSSINPATNQTIWTGNSASNQQIESAIQAARKAFECWSQEPLEARQNLLFQFAHILQENKEKLAECISNEIGKPFWESLTEVQAMIGKVSISIEAYTQRCSEFQGGPAVTRFKPHGVCAVLAPFNFPAHLPNGHIVPALLAGNTIIFKPSTAAPLVAQETMKLWIEAGLPKGVINLIQGDASEAEFIASHPQVDGVFFTGSAHVGLLLNEKLARQPNKILALEMGGNNPLIVHDVNDLTAAAYLAVQSAFLSAGQRCTCARRLILPEGPQSDQFLQLLIDITKKINVGDHTDRPEPFMGPVISHKTALNILNKQNTLIEKGANPLLKTTLLKENTGLLSPGIIDVSNIDQTMDEEIFGPLLQCIRVKDFHSAIEVANKTRYGLSAGILTDNSELYKIFYNKSKAGIINWNQQLTGASSSAPFGGLGWSGNHRPSGFFAADYCSYPVASIEINQVKLPEHLTPGIKI